MAFWVYGRDQETGEQTELYSEAASEDAARAEATEQGLIVERVEASVAPDQPELPAQPFGQLKRTPPPPPLRMTFSGLALGIAEFVSFIGCLVSVYYLLIGSVYLIYPEGENYGREYGFYLNLAAIAAFFYNAALAIVFSYVRKQLQRERRKERLRRPAE